MHFNSQAFVLSLLLNLMALIILYAFVALARYINIPIWFINTTLILILCLAVIKGFYP